MPLSGATAARDAIYGCLKAAVEASALPTLPIYYPDSVKTSPDGNTNHIRAFMDLTTERQVAVGAHQQRRYRVYGIITVQCFTTYGDGQTSADQISGIVKGAFRGVNTGADAITFRNARVVDVGHDGPYLQTNVIAEFDYDEIA